MYCSSDHQPIICLHLRLSISITVSNCLSPYLPTYQCVRSLYLYSNRAVSEGDEYFTWLWVSSSCYSWRLCSFIEQGGEKRNNIIFWSAKGDQVKELVPFCINKVCWEWTCANPCTMASHEWRKHAVSEFIRLLHGQGRGAKQVTQHCRIFATVYSLKRKHADPSTPLILLLLICFTFQKLLVFYTQVRRILKGVTTLPSFQMCLKYIIKESRFHQLSGNLWLNARKFHWY